MHPGRPEVLEDLLDPAPGPARAVIRRWLDLRGCEVIGGRAGRTGGKVVLPRSPEEQWGIGVALSRFRQLFNHWADGRRPGHNPLQMDPDRSRMRDGDKRKVKRGETRWWLDVDGLFRTRQVQRQAPRPDDQAAALRILGRGREMGWPEEVQLLFEGMYLTGARRGQLGVATVYGLLVAAPIENRIMLVQKGSDGALAWPARMPPDYLRRVHAMLDRRTVGGLARLRRLAKSKDPVDHATLRAIYIFSPDGRVPVPQWRLSHLLRVVVEDLGMCFEIGDGAEARRWRWFTSHWFRHMFVNRVLDRIAESAMDEAARRRARDKLGAYMGWKHPEAMLAYYGRYHFEREVDHMVAEHQDDLKVAIDGVLGEDALSNTLDGGLWLPERKRRVDLLA